MYRIEKFNKDYLEKWLDFFDNRAFSDNPYWKSCYCTFFHRPKLQGLEKNREYAIELIKENKLKGYIALDDKDKIVGWCNVNEKRNLNKLIEKTKNIPDDSVISIVCFVIEKEHRKKGLTSLIIKKIIEDAKNEGKKVIEAYPAITATTDASNFKGRFTTYQRFGFVEQKEGRKVVMRLKLKD